MVGPAEVFLACADADEALRAELLSHLSVLEKSGAIRCSDAELLPGEAPATVLPDRVGRADLVLLLVSVDFVASAECDELQVRPAMARADTRQATVVPVLLKPCDWRGTPFGDLAPLPKDGRPVLSRTDRDQAFLDVVMGVRELVRGMRAPESRASSRPRALLVSEVLQRLRRPNTVGVALLEPFGFQAHQVAGEVIEQLRRPGETLFPVRLVPERWDAKEEGLYERLLRDLRWGLPEAWRSTVDAHKERRLRDRFDYTVQDLLNGPVRASGMQLLFVIDGFAQLPATQLERWGQLLARLSGHGLKLLIWGGQELYDLRTRPPSGGHFSAFHVVDGVWLGPLSRVETSELVTAHGASAEAGRAVFEQTSGHPALVNELVNQYPADVRAADPQAIAARVRMSEHMARVRRAVAADKRSRALLKELARLGDAPLLRGQMPEDEDRIRLWGIVNEAGATSWSWSAPAMKSLALELQ